MENYNRLTNDELNDFLQRAVVQLCPELTRQLLSIGLELAQYRDKIENRTLVEVDKPYIKQQSNGLYIVCVAKEVGITMGTKTKAEAEEKLKELQNT